MVPVVAAEDETNLAQEREAGSLLPVSHPSSYGLKSLRGG